MGDKVYIYEDFSGFDVVLSREELQEDKLYDPDCDESMRLIIVTSDIDDLIKCIESYGFIESTNRYEELLEEFKELSGGINGVNSK